MGARPPRWLKCPRKSAIIADRFVAFKTFLDEKFDSQVEEEYQFQFPMLRSFVQSRKMELGLVIDLTNTSRFYDASTVRNNNVGYVKLACRGHGDAPASDQVNVFIDICKKYIGEHPDRIIGVHCTHGFNRTGFLVIAYLVEVENWSVEAAYMKFAQTRPPGIYKQGYLVELWQRYGGGDAPPAAPALPDWCVEEEEGVSDEEEGGNRNGMDPRIRNGGDGGPPAKRRRKSHAVESPQFVEGVEGVEAVSPRGRERLQEICEGMLGWDRCTFPGAQPVSLDRKNIEYLNQKPYRVSWKADGTRYLLLILQQNEVYLFDRDNSVFLAEHLLFPRRKSPDQHIENTLVDGELVFDKEGDKLHPRFLIYDIIKFEGQDVGKTDLERRLLCIDKEIIGPRTIATQAGKLDKTKEPFSVRKKDFYPLDKAGWIVDKLNPKIPHETDGLILQPATDEYTPGQCPYILKWKPHELNSVDFMLNIHTVTKYGCLPEKIGGLYVQGYDQPFSSLKVTAELKHYDKRIVECSWDEKNKQWHFLRVREDKSFPNSLNTAQSVCESIRNPVTKDMLCDYITRHGHRPPVPKFNPQPTTPTEPAAVDEQIPTTDNQLDS